MIEPSKKLLSPIVVEILCGPPIKVRIELMNHGSKFLDGLKTNVVSILKEEGDAVEDSSDPNQGEDIVGRRGLGFGCSHFLEHFLFSLIDVVLLYLA